METTAEKTDKRVIADALAAAAVRASMIGREPATNKQIWYLACLMAEVDDNSLVGDTNLVLTKRKASKLIDFYKRLAEEK